ncbi:MAG TPA: hypothetical protein VF723_18300 [Pyrinomonadaceae bacterium]
MQRCPSCNQTYPDDAQSFCLNDGTPLVRDTSAPYDPQATMLNVPPPQTNYPTPPQGYYQNPNPQPGANQTPPPPWPNPYGQQQQQYGAPPYAAAAPTGKNKLPLILGGVAVLLIGAGVLFFLLSGSKSETANNNSNNSNSSNNSNNSNRSPVTTNANRPITIPTPAATTGTTTSTTVSTGSYSNDEAHKLFQAVGITKDQALIIEVAQKIGIVEASGQPNDKFQPFIDEHYKWAPKNAAWIRQYLTPEKAREYVMENK